MTNLTFAGVTSKLALTFAAASSLPAQEVKPNSVERLLAAAGFEAIPANTPQRQTELTTLKPNKLVAQAMGDGFTYIYADPKRCACLYMGDADDYAAYQKLAAKQRIADENANAAADASFAAWNWQTWGPYSNWGWNGGLFNHWRY
jgi:hypothetical protein